MCIVFRGRLRRKGKSTRFKKEKAGKDGKGRRGAPKKFIIFEIVLFVSLHNEINSLVVLDFDLLFELCT